MLKTSSISERSIELRTGDTFLNPDMAQTSAGKLDEYVQGSIATSSPSIPFRGVLFAATGDGKEIKALLKDLKRRRKRDEAKKAIVALYKDTSDKALRAQIVDDLIAMLEHKRSYVRSAAIDVLGDLGDTRAVQHIIPLLQDKSKDVRRYACESLGKLGDVSAVNAIIPLLFDEVTSNRKWASWALSELGEEDTWNSIVMSLHYDELEEELKTDIANSLRIIGSVESIRPLVDLYANGDEGIRWYASWGLSRIKDLHRILYEHIDFGEVIRLSDCKHEEVQRAALISIIKNEHQIKKENLDVLYEESLKLLESEDESARYNSLVAFYEIGKAAVGLLEYPENRKFLFDTGRIVNRLFALMKDENYKISSTASAAHRVIISAMINGGEEKLLDRYFIGLSIGLSDEDDDFRRSLRYCYRMVGDYYLNLGDARPMTHLALKLKNSKNPKVRGDAAILFEELSAVMMKIGNVNTLKHMKKNLTTVIDLLLKGAVSYQECRDSLLALDAALATYGDDTVVKKLKALVVTKNKKLVEARIEAVKLLGEIGDERALDALISVTKDRSWNDHGLFPPELKSQMGASIAMIGGARADSMLIDIYDLFYRDIPMKYHDPFIRDIARGYELGVKSKQKSSDPLIRGDTVFFPRGSIPTDAKSVTVAAYREALPRPQTKEVSFVFDCSASMKGPAFKDGSESKFDFLMGAFKDIMSVLPSGKEIHYKLNTFGPKEDRPGFEVGGDGGSSPHKHELIGHMEALGEKGPEGATPIWSNIRHTVTKAERGGVIIVYSDGRSDISHEKKCGDHEFKGRSAEFDDFRRRLAGDIQAKDLQVHVILGNQGNADDECKSPDDPDSNPHAEFSNFASMSENVEFYVAGEMREVGKILKDVATTKILGLKDVTYAYIYEDGEGKLKPMNDFKMPVLSSKDASYRVREGVRIDEATGRIEIRDLTLEDGDAQRRELGIEEYSVSGPAEIKYEPVGKELPKGKMVRPIVTLALDNSNSMNEKTGLFTTKADLLKKASKEFCNYLIEGGARVNINSYSTSDEKVEIIDSSNLNDIENFIDRMKPKGASGILSAIAESIVATPRGGSVITFTDAQEYNSTEEYDDLLRLAKAKGVRLYFIHYKDNLDNITYLGRESGIGGGSDDPEYVNKVIGKWKECRRKLREAAKKTGGKFISFDKFKNIYDAFEELKPHLEKEHNDVTMPLPKPKEILIPIKTKDGEEILLKYEL